jgi:2,6-dihydroxypyridine 3-monooxygenase
MDVPARPLRIIIVGGSLGGLSAAVWLRDLGCDVEVFERAPVFLEDRGAGIMLNPATVRYFLTKKVTDVRQTSAPIRRLQYMNRAGRIVSSTPAFWWSSAYNVLYRGLLGCFDRTRYHLGEECVGFEQDESGVTVRFATGRVERGDLAVFADGINSIGRRLLLPECRPRYAGYVAWRGTVSEENLKPETFGLFHEAITYHVLGQGHALAYPIPNRDGTAEPGRRLTNWLWYRNVDAAGLADLLVGRDGQHFTTSVPAGFVAEGHVQKLHADAREQLPPPFAEIIGLTGEPFIEVIFDVEVPRMAFGRVCLLGDAAFRARPHAAAGTAKAAEDAYRLALALKAHRGDVAGALREWETAQLALGRAVVERARQAGERLQHGRWRVGEPVPFGLYEVSDSSMPEETLAEASQIR